MVRDDMEKLGGLLRFVTPILVTVSLFVITLINSKIDTISERLYHHQTNDEIHIPRGEFVNIQNQIIEMRRDVIESIREERTGRKHKGD